MHVREFENCHSALTELPLESIDIYVLVSYFDLPYM